MQPQPSFTIASGPFIAENGKLLLVKEQKAEGVTPWILPGGRFETSDVSLEATAIREAAEELGIAVTLGRPLKPLLREHIILIAYVATRTGEIKPATDIVEWAWHDISQLPTDCEKSIYQFVEDYNSMI